MLSDVQSLFSLPLETLAILSAGYLGYRLAYTGKNYHHKAVDAVFISVAFGMIAGLGINAFFLMGAPTSSALVIGVACALIASVVWRKWFHGKVSDWLRDKKVSVHDGYHTAWQTLIADDGMEIAQVVVQAKDGSAYMCEDVSQFNKARTGASLLGADGSVAIYVTHFREAGKSEWQTCDTVKHDWGNAITYIPAENIKFIEARVLED